MFWKNRSYTMKGFIVGVSILLLVFLFASFSSNLANYSSAKGAYDGYNFVIKNCGNDPSNDCLNKLCPDFYNSKWNFCETMNPHALNYGQTSWRNFVSSEKPNISEFLIPNFKNGLETLLFMPILTIFGLFLLVGLMIRGYFLDKRARVKNLG